MAERVDIIDIDLSELQEESESTGQTLKELKDEVKELKKTLDGTTLGTDEFTEALEQLNKKQDELKNATRTSSKALAGSYNAISKEMSDLKKVWKATADEAERDALGKQIDALNDKLKELDGTVGVNTRNVGNYQSALDGLGDITLEDKIESSEKLAENMGHVARLGAGLSGVFEIVEGGMNLMGIESEKMEEAMLKIQSLMAITQGMSAIGDSVESFTKLTKAVKESEVWTKLFTKSKKEESTAVVANTVVQNANTVATKAGTTATKGLKKALISSGIGAIIVGIGVAVAALVDNWDKLTEAFSRSKDQSDEFKASIDALESSMESLGRERNLDIELMKVEGATELDVINKQRENARADLVNIQAELDKLESKKRLNKKEKEQLERVRELEQAKWQEIQDLNDKATIAEAKMRKAEKDAAEEAKNDAIENAKKVAEEKKKQREEEEKENKKLAEEKKKEEEEARKEAEETQKKYSDLVKKTKFDLLSSLDQEIQSNKEAQETELADLKKANELKVISDEEYLDLKNQVTEKYAIKEQEIKTKYEKEEEARQEEIRQNRLDAEVEAREKEIEILQGQLDGLNLMFDSLLVASDSIIGTADGISGAWSNVFGVLQAGVNNLGESLKAGEKGWQTYANVIRDSLGVAGAVMMALADEQDENSKEGFEKEKKFQIAAAVMNTLAGIVAATTSAMNPMNAWMTLPGQIAMAASTSAMITAMGAIQVSKIKQQKFEGGGEDISNPSTPSLTAVNAISKPLNFTSNVEGASAEAKVKDTKVYVTETDITEVQDRVKVAETEATF